MSEKIDWSKAPEGCIGAFTSKHDFRSVGFSPFFVITKRYSDYGAQAGCSGEDQDGKEYHVFEKYWDYHEKPASWSGEGLPPVGVVCEYRCVNDQWRQVKVIAHMIEMQKDNPCAVSQLGDTGPLCIGGASSFRKIRTPEQIAADERESAIDAMWSHYLQPILAPAQKSQVITALGLMYDAGFRKP